MFTKITTTALLAGLALATATALPLSGAMAHTTGSHGGKSAGGGHSSSASRGDHTGDRGDRGDRSFGGGAGNGGGAAGTLGTALGVAHALGIPGF